MAYADFVTALMSLFIVLWLMNSGREVREAVSTYFRDPKGRLGQSGSAQAGSGQALAVDSSNVRSLKEHLERAMARLPEFRKFQQYVHFTITGEGLRVELMERAGGMFFQTGNTKPSREGEALLGMLAAELGQLPNQIVLEGHTDALPYRSSAADAYGNWELSMDRANVARRTMVARGVPPDQIGEIRGYADRRPLIEGDPNDTRNRRISVILRFQGAVN